MKPSQRYALALQKIQIEQIRSLVHPQIWAALTLIGDW
jgi:CHAT domain-containing protein